MLLPALARAKRKAEQANCVSNFKQMGLAVNMYAADNDDWLPPGEVTRGGVIGLDEVQPAYYNDSSTAQKSLPYYLTAGLSLPSPSTVHDPAVYVSRAFICPGYAHTMGLPSSLGVVTGTDANTFKTAYSVSTLRFHQRRLRHYLLSIWQAHGRYSSNEVFPAHRLCAIGEHSLGDSGCGGPDVSLTPASSFTDKLPTMAPHPVHGATRNFLFFDYHRRFQVGQQVGPGQDANAR